MHVCAVVEQGGICCTLMMCLGGHPSKGFLTALLCTEAVVAMTGLCTSEPVLVVTAVVSVLVSEQNLNTFCPDDFSFTLLLGITVVTHGILKKLGGCCPFSLLMIGGQTLVGVSSQRCFPPQTEDHNPCFPQAQT